MALKTAGTAATTSCFALVWQPSGMNQTDLANLVSKITDPVAGAFGASAATSKGYIENGFLFLPNSLRYPQGLKLVPGDYILVDGAGNPFVVPYQNFATSWVHS